MGSFDMFPFCEDSITVSVPYLIRPKYGFNTVSTGCRSWVGKSVRARKVTSCPDVAYSLWSVGLGQLHGHTLSVVLVHLGDSVLGWHSLWC